MDTPPRGATRDGRSRRRGIHRRVARRGQGQIDVGRALRDSGVPRGEVFVTTKFYPGRKFSRRRPDPVATAEQSLQRLRVDQLDLYLIRWPGGGPTWAWPRTQQALERGLARSIGVSNFSARELDEVIAAATIPPVVNQVQFSP